jgi:hypothetical protein
MEAAVAEEGFLSRWSRRKAGQAPAEPVPQSVPMPVPEALPQADAAAPAAQAEPSLPPPTLEDVKQLTPSTSDFSRFVAPDVDETVKRAALKTLFSDSHFNRMDGLDVYIEDYTQFTPVSQSVLRRMVQSEALGLWREERTPKPPSEAKPDGAAAGAVPQSNELPTQPSADDAEAPPPHDENPDLQLQPDDAAGRVGPAPGPEPGGR